MEKRYKPDSKLKTSPKIIVVTGAESTGKSTLTEALAKHFDAPFCPEFAREYIENLKDKYNYQDVEQIAKKQIELLEELKNSESPIVFVDTWLIITKIWFDVVFHTVPLFVEEEIKNTKIHLFLVCDTDLPWIPDNVRENGGENRLKLQNRYIEEIEKYGFNYKIVSGENNTRLKNAVQYLSFYVKNKN
jgi:NadR type nicotinamide-nucleotide adenylyltransferase